VGPEEDKDQSMDKVKTGVAGTTTLMDHYRRECREWRRSVRAALYREFHTKDILVVSDNHVYELIYNLRKVLPPPLRPDGERTGLARTHIFTEREYDLPTNQYYRYYEPTEDITHSADPSARSRKIRVFRYIPEEDPRCLTPTGKVRSPIWHDDDDL
jgi:hypothetical protein